jgi:hypothetical protein
MLIGPDPTPGDEQSRMNLSTQGQWNLYAPHRRKIEELIRPRQRGERLCVLGAGNCNDLDLTWLVEAFAEVHLVDIDPAALERAAARQAVAGHTRLTLHAPFDLTAIAELTLGWKGRRVEDAEADRAIETTRASEAIVAGGGFDLVLSPCVLSQLWCGVRDLVGKDHPKWPALKMAIGARHMRMMTQSPKACGRGVAIVDLTSTKSVVGLERARPDEAAKVMEMSLGTGKYFKGLAPREMVEGFSRAGAKACEVSAPWVWHLAWQKAFLCYGLTARLT